MIKKDLTTSVKDQEVEVRAVLNKEQLLLITKYLEEQKKYKGQKTIKDMYFCKKEIESFDKLEMKEIGSYSLRLRISKKDNEKEKIELNTKCITTYNDHSSWRENETRVSSFNETKDILKTIGFKPFFTVKKKRKIFTGGDITYNLENIEDFGDIIEIEKITTKDQALEAKKEIFSILKKIGISDIKPVEKSVTNMLMRARAFQE